METLLPLVWIACIVCFFLVWYFFHNTRHKERMLIIEKTLDTDELLQAETKKNLEKLLNNEKKSRFLWFKLGIVVIGLSIGLLIISLLAGAKLLDKGGNASSLPSQTFCMYKSSIS